MSRIIVVGSVAQDDVVTLCQPLAAGRHLDAAGRKLRLGGGGANPAIPLRHAGHEVALVAPVGGDDVAEWLLAKLQGASIDVSAVVRVPKEKYGDARRTEIIPNAEEFNPEDFYADDEMVITISHMGYIKRTPLTDFRRQNRGGVGAKGSTTRDEDFIEHLYIATMHNTMLFFTRKGKCYWLKVYSIPEGTRTSKGRAIQNLISIEPDDNVRAFINVKDLSDDQYINNNYIVLCSTNGVIKKTSLEAYSRPRASGVNAITVREGDELLALKS